MNTPTSTTRVPVRGHLPAKLLTVVALAALSACGGGGGETATAAAPETMTASASPGALSFGADMAAHAMAADGRKARLAAEAVNGVDTSLLLDWAEFKFADLFPKARVKKYPLTFEGKNYSVREYVSGAVTRYLGVTDTGEIYGLGDFTNNVLTSFGKLSDWATQVLGDRCGVSATLCNNPPPAGPLNACAMPASQFLVAGNRFNATYVTLGEPATETVSESVVEGASTFENQASVRIKSNTRTTTSTGIPGFPGLTVTAEGNTHHQAGSGGLTLTLGVETTTVNGGVVVGGVPIGGSTSVSRIVFNPVDINLQFTIAQGQSLTKYTTAITTVLGKTVTVISGTTYTFEGVENITVQGRSYATCRYLETPQDASGSTKVWYIQGKGVPARSVSTFSSGLTGTQTTTVELKTGAINGQPL